MKFHQVQRTNGETFFPQSEGHLQVRYSRPNGQPKNTLLTFHTENEIFFGISRCNLNSNDKFSKRTGKAIAVDRMLHAKNRTLGSVINNTVFLIIGGNQLWGCCRKDEIARIFNHFDNIDEAINTLRKRKYQKQKERAA